MFAAFLGFLEHQMERRPDLITPATRGDPAEADELLAGVEVDRDAELGESFRIPGARKSKRTSRRPSK